MIQRLFKDTMIYGLSAILSRGLSLITLPIYARFLAPADYGALDIFMVIGSLANLVVAMEINQALSRFINEAGQAKRRVLASTALWFTLFSYSAALALSLFFSEWICLYLLGDLRYLGEFQLGLCAIAANGMFYLFQSQLRFELLSRDYAIVSIIYSVVSVAFGLALGKFLNFGLGGIIAAQLIAAVLAGVISMTRLPGRYGLVVDTSWLRIMLAFSLPLVPSGVATFFTLYANRILLNSLADLHSVGLFGIAARFAGIVGILIIGIQSALTPLIYTHYKEPETPSQLAKIAHGFTVVAFACCLFLGLFASEMLQLLVPADYLGAARIVLMLSLSTLLSQMYVFFPGIAIAKRTTYQLMIFVVTAVASVALNWFLIPPLGVIGAGVATLLSSLLFIALWIYASQRLYPLPLKIFRMALAAVLVVVAGAAGQWLEAWLSPGILLICAKASVMLLFVASAFALRLLPVLSFRRPRIGLLSRVRSNR